MSPTAPPNGKIPLVPSGFQYFAFGCLLVLGSLGGCLFAVERGSGMTFLVLAILFVAGLFLDGLATLLKALGILQRELRAGRGERED